MTLFRKWAMRMRRPAELTMADGLSKLASVQPESIYIEHVCIAFNVSRIRARKICEEAVDRGLLSRTVQVLFPDGRVAASACRYEDLPDVVQYSCHLESTCASRVGKTANLSKREIFSLPESRVSSPNSRAAETGRWTRWPTSDRQIRW
jgi:hypothetical protein